jgi:hypothetical protein
MSCANRPPIKEVYSLLKEKKALIVHFSGVTNKLNSPDKLFPNDLLYAINHKNCSGRSCSIIKPDDNFMNAVGSIGIILGLKQPNSLLDAFQADCGWHVNSNPKDKITIKELRDTIEGRSINCHNEWVVNNYLVLGIFAIEPFQVMAYKPLDMPHGIEINLTPKNEATCPKLISLSEIKSYFVNIPIYTFRGGRIKKYAGDGDNAVEIDHSEIYHSNCKLQWIVDSWWRRA